MAESRWHNIALYGVGIQEARASGDVSAMETVAQRAEKEGADDPEIQAALTDLRAEIARLRGRGEAGMRPLYAVVIQEARASGDVHRMRDVASRARSEGSDDPEIQSALRDLEAEINRAGG